MKTNQQKSQKDHDCTKCKLIHCINLYGKGTEEMEGGEIYVLDYCLKNNEYTLCEGGGLLDALCQLLKEFKDFTFYELFYQCIRDLKASLFLLISGHYRGAIQLLRPVVENWLAGVYWDSKLAEFTENNEEYEKFRTEEKYEVSEKEWNEVFGNEKKSTKKRHLDQEFLSSWMMKREIIDGEYKQEINTMCGKLNKYLHPNFSTMDIKKAGREGYPAWVKYNKKEYEKCMGLFQDTATLLLNTLLQYLTIFPSPKMDDEEFLKEVLGPVIALKDIEKDSGRAVIHSKKLQQFIEDISPQQ